MGVDCDAISAKFFFKKIKRLYVVTCIENFKRFPFFFVSVTIFFSTEKRKDFERRRKLHYNEFEAVLRARELMEQDEDEENN